ncbi:hypothetical protein EZV62_018869 [Acer yangbiense]|uniref:Uncharacterized protein n=1 Tax=Acer yangbiense TaxID=1000413 RepID=A0A5C7H8Z6_9ROSI|nr:hypothetical protein EZV62_018869 [Acer yangbiense]
MENPNEVFFISAQQTLRNEVSKGDGVNLGIGGTSKRARAESDILGRHDTPRKEDNGASIMDRNGAGGSTKYGARNDVVDGISNSRSGYDGSNRSVEGVVVKVALGKKNNMKAGKHTKNHVRSANSTGNRDSGSRFEVLGEEMNSRSRARSVSAITEYFDLESGCEVVKSLDRDETPFLGIEALEAGRGGVGATLTLNLVFKSRGWGSRFVVPALLTSVQHGMPYGVVRNSNVLEILCCNEELTLFYVVLWGNWFNRNCIVHGMSGLILTDVVGWVESFVSYFREANMMDGHMGWTYFTFLISLVAPHWIKETANSMKTASQVVSLFLSGWIMSSEEILKMCPKLMLREGDELVQRLHERLVNAGAQRLELSLVGKEIGHFLGSMVGIMSEEDVGTSGECPGDFLRVRVRTPPKSLLLLWATRSPDTGVLRCISDCGSGGVGGATVWSLVKSHSPRTEEKLEEWKIFSYGKNNDFGKNLKFDVVDNGFTFKSTCVELSVKPGLLIKVDGPLREPSSDGAGTVALSLLGKHMGEIVGGGLGQGIGSRFHIDVKVVSHVSKAWCQNTGVMDGLCYGV